MPEFGKRSKSCLSEAHIDLQKVFNIVIQIYDCSVICGHRGRAEQNKAYDKGNSKLRYPDSKHNKQPSQAVDAVPYPIDWNDINRFKELAGHVKMCAYILYSRGEINHLIRWGGDWKSFKDYPHYEIYKP